jgi:outer membrane protein
LKTASVTLPKYFAVLALCGGSIGSMVAAHAQNAAVPVTPLASAAVAPPSRVAWLSAERIYNESKLAKQAGEKLQAEFSGRDKAVQELAARFKVANEKWEKDVGTLAEPERSRRQKELFDLDKELQRRQREFREDLNQRTNEERAAIAQKANDIISGLAKTEGFDVVLQEALWASPRIDITDKVLKALDK